MLAVSQGSARSNSRRDIISGMASRGTFHRVIFFSALHDRLKNLPGGMEFVSSRKKLLSATMASIAGGRLKMTPMMAITASVDKAMTMERDFRAKRLNN